MTLTRFGRVDSTDVHEVTLANGGGAKAKIITYGAIVRDLVVPSASGPQHVVLGLTSIEDYSHYARYMGAIVGRYANRIGGGRFELDGRTFQLDLNENGRQHLHGGSKGFAQRVWSVLARTADSVTLALVSENGEMGYPGRLVATCTYALLEPATLRVVLEATADQTTPVNLTTHLYYNLDGSPDILDHELQIAAEHVTPTDDELIPTGEVRSVAGTSYDFRGLRPVREAKHVAEIEYDINFVLWGAHGSLHHAATLLSRKSRIAMELWTTEPGLQFYGGHKLDVPSGGLGGRSYGRYGGLCLEPQRFPDAPNKPHFPPCVLHPGEVLRQASELRFSLA